MKELLQERNISMGKLSRLSDLSLSTINRVCNDPTYSPTLNTMERIAKALGVRVQDLFEETPDNQWQILVYIVLPINSSSAKMQHSFVASFEESIHFHKGLPAL